MLGENHWIKVRHGFLITAYWLILFGRFNHLYVWCAQWSKSWDYELTKVCVEKIHTTPHELLSHCLIKMYNFLLMLLVVGVWVLLFLARLVFFLLLRLFLLLLLLLCAVLLVVVMVAVLVLVVFPF